MEHPLDRPSSWHGQLTLEFAHQNDGTSLTHRLMQAPLKVQRPFYPEGPEVCHVVTLHTAGGVVGGDRLSQSLHLHARSHALVTTATAGKIYHSTGAESCQMTQLRLAAGACLEWLPQESIVFNGARYRQHTRIELEDEAVWLGWEITRLGRTARGERFETGEWRSHTEVWQKGSPLWIDAQRVQGGTRMMTSPHGLGGCPVVGSFAIVGRSLSSELVEKARYCWRAEGNPSLHAKVGVTRLMAGLLCRYRGTATLEARRWFTQVWELVRLEMMGRSMCKPRVW